MRSIVLFAAVLSVLMGCRGAPTKTTDSGVADVAAGTRAVSAAEASGPVSKAYSQFIDLRPPGEYADGHAARAVNIPVETLAAKLDILEKSEPVYLIDDHGDTAKDAASLLKNAGFNNVLTVTGGIAAWKSAGLPMETKPPHNVPPPPG